MPTTDPTYGWPIPVAADPPDGPGQFAALAAAIAATLNISGDSPATILWEYHQDDTWTPTNGTYSLSFAGTTPAGWQWATPPHLQIHYRQASMPSTMRVYAISTHGATGADVHCKTEAGAVITSAMPVHWALIGRIEPTP